MEYREPSSASRSQLDERLAAHDYEAAAEAVIALSLDDPDGAWVQERVVALTSHASPAVRAAAVLALGHLARLHPELPSTAAAAAVRGADVPVGRAKDALDDISAFSEDQRGGTASQGASGPSLRHHTRALDDEKEAVMELPALQQLMAAYLHQDWDLDYDTDEETIRAFVLETPDVASDLPREISDVLSTVSAEADVEALLVSLGCQVDPSPTSNGSYRTWLTELAAYAREALERGGTAS